MELEREAAPHAVALALAAAGLVVPPDETIALAEHLRMVYEANRTLNLTTVTADDAPALHVVDSIRGLASMERGGDGPWADLGSGAGYPGIPLCIHGRRHVDLIESIGKKARFLEAVSARLCLDATVRDLRAEDAARETPEMYSALSARAVGRLGELAELASPLLRPHGVLVAWKGALTDEELQLGRRVGEIVGLRVQDVVEYGLPGSDARRVLVILEKTRRSAVPLPRRAGLAKRSPLG